MASSHWLLLDKPAYIRQICCLGTLTDPHTKQWKGGEKGVGDQDTRFNCEHSHVAYQIKQRYCQEVSHISWAFVFCVVDAVF